MPQIQQVFKGNMSVYGADKVWRALKRQDVEVARCTVERLMRRLGLRGAMRGKGVCTTVPDAKAACPQDRVNRGVQSGSTQPVVGQRLHLRRLLLPQSLAGLRLRGLPG